MELLKIENAQGFLCIEGNEDKLVSQVTTEDISKAVEIVLSDESVTIPDAIDCSSIVNPAQKIIFEQLHLSLKEVFASRDMLKSEIDEVFAQAEKKYLNNQQCEQETL